MSREAEDAALAFLLRLDPATQREVLERYEEVFDTELNTESRRLRRVALALHQPKREVGGRSPTFREYRALRRGHPEWGWRPGAELRVLDCRCRPIGGAEMGRRGMTEFAIPLPPELVEAIAERAAELVLERMQARADGEAPRWLYGAQAAADYLAQPVGRIQKLTAAKRIPHHRLEGEQRVSYRTDELDAWLDGYYEGPPPALGAVG